ncbi:MAG TPA: universal stress protein [Longimicrobiales bacterium]|nr:universal stress protein [Longimicrobiales bacterium]
MIRRLLVPLDGSTFGEHALPQAIALARRHDATLDLAHVHEVASLVYMEGVPLIDASVELEGMEHDRGYLDGLLERVVALGVKATATLLDGPTVSALEAHVEALHADLIVMTTHGRGPLSRAWLGSVADGLARHTSRPVLLIRPADGADAIDAPRPDPAAAPPPLRRVLVPLDPSRESESVIEHALAVADAGASLLLLHVAPPAVVVGGHVFPVDPARQRDMIDAAYSSMEDTANGLRARGVDAVLEVVVSRDVATSILEAALRESIDLIALTKHGRGELSRLVFGSVTDKVLRGASLPVLIRRPG